MPVTLNNGYEMRAWYDIYSLNKNGPQDQLGMERARQSIEALIAEEIQRGIPSDRIALAGFSQGGAVALHTALRFPTTLAGVMALSTYMPSADRLAAEKHTANQHSPILMAHGDFDEVITPETAMYARDILRAEGYAVEWHTYEMAHSVTPQEIDDIRQFIQKILPE
jgi:phospholipase/carboxylesterase